MKSQLPLKSDVVYQVFVDLEDMGTLRSSCKGTTSETAEQNALWHINNAREHDNLPPIGLQDFLIHCKYGDITFEE